MGESFRKHKFKAPWMHFNCSLRPTPPLHKLLLSLWMNLYNITLANHTLIYRFANLLFCQLLWSSADYSFHHPKFKALELDTKYSNSHVLQPKIPNALIWRIIDENLLDLNTIMGYNILSHRGRTLLSLSSSVNFNRWRCFLNEHLCLVASPKWYTLCLT